MEKDRNRKGNLSALRWLNGSFSVFGTIFVCTFWDKDCIDVYCASSDIRVQASMQQIVVAQRGSSGPFHSLLNPPSGRKSELQRAVHFLWVCAPFFNPSFSLRQWALTTAVSAQVSSLPSPHVIKCHYTLISLFICPLTSSSFLTGWLSARHPLGTHALTVYWHVQKAGKQFIFPLWRPMDLGRRQQ